MYSYEERLRAVKLYLKYGRRLQATIRELGYRRIQAELNRRRVFISEKVVRRLMKQDGHIAARPKRRRYRSYVGEISPAPENLINRDFHATAPKEKWGNPPINDAHQK